MYDDDDDDDEVDEVDDAEPDEDELIQICTQWDRKDHHDFAWRINRWCDRQLEAGCDMSDIEETVYEILDRKMSVEPEKEMEGEVPFGHDVGNEHTRNVSSIMYNYRTGGTPWFIFIDRGDTVVFNGFHLDTKKAIQFLKGI